MLTRLNQLTGCLSPTLGLLTSITHLYLGRNRLTTFVPAVLSELILDRYDPMRDDDLSDHFQLQDLCEGNQLWYLSKYIYINLNNPNNPNNSKTFVKTTSSSMYHPHDLNNPGNPRCPLKGGGELLSTGVIAQECQVLEYDRGMHTHIHVYTYITTLIHTSRSYSTCISPTTLIIPDNP